MKPNKKKKPSEFRQVINSVRHMSKKLNNFENPLPKIKIKQ